MLPKAVETTGDQITSFSGDSAVCVAKARKNNETFGSTIARKYKGSHVAAGTNSGMIDKEEWQTVTYDMLWV